MRIKLMILAISLTIINFDLTAESSLYKNTPMGWIDSDEIRISGDIFYLDTNLGVIELNVIEYDPETKRYLVECVSYGNTFYPTPEE